MDLTAFETGDGKANGKRKEEGHFPQGDDSILVDVSIIIVSSVASCQFCVDTLSNAA
jgi:hypothetical protein